MRCLRFVLILEYELPVLLTETLLQHQLNARAEMDEGVLEISLLTCGVVRSTQIHRTSSSLFTRNTCTMNFRSRSLSWDYRRAIASCSREIISTSGTILRCCTHSCVNEKSRALGVP
jgi:hypothetical protein